MATQGPKHHAHVPFATVLFTLASSPLDFFVIISLKSAFEAIWIDGCSDNDIFWICMATRFCTVLCIPVLQNKPQFASCSLYSMFSTVQQLTSILKVQNNLAKMIYQPGHTQLTLDILLILLSQ